MRFSHIALALVLAPLAAAASPLAIEPPPSTPPRALHVERVACEAAQEPDGYPALLVSAPIAAVGLGGETLAVEVTLRGADGQRLGAASLTDRVLYDRSSWTPFRVPVPGRGLALSPATTQRVIVRLQARCAGLTSGAEGEALFPFVAGPAPARAVRLLSVTATPGQPYVVTGLNEQAAPGYGLATTPVGFATRVDARAEADGMRGETLELALRLRHPDGRPVAAAPHAPPGFVDENQTFHAVTRDPIRFDTAAWGALFAWIPAGAPALEAGKVHRVVLGCRVTAGGLVAWAEQELDLVGAVATERSGGVDGKALCEALTDGDTARALAELDAGAPTDARDPRGRTALHLAAAYGMTEVAERLIERGARLDATDESGRTPVHLAALRGRDATLIMLLTRGASPVARDRRGRRAADLAEDEACADLLRRATEGVETSLAPARRCVEELLAARSIAFRIVSVEPAPGGARVLVRLSRAGNAPRVPQLLVSFGLTRHEDRWSVTTFRREVEP